MFDTTTSGTSDPDLEDPWSGGNLASTTILENILIIQENSIGCGDDICDVPDNEEGPPAGSFEIVFGNAVSSIGFDLIDIDDTNASAPIPEPATLTMSVLAILSLAFFTWRQRGRA